MPKVPKKPAPELNANGKILKRYDYIDALRGIAILGVLIAHTHLFGDIQGLPLWLRTSTDIYIGPRGVQLFYVISAFTLCLSFSKRSLIEKHSVINFYIRRFFRIAPLFYLSIIYYLWQQNFWNANPNHFSLLNILTTFTFTNGVFPAFISNIVFGGWSIAIESTFYLVFPLLFYFYYKLKSIKIVLLITILTSITMQFLRLYLLSLPIIQKSSDLQVYTFWFFPSQLPVFLIGIVVFLITRLKLNETDKKTIIMFLFGVTILLIAQIFLPLKFIPGHYIYGLIFGLLLFFLSKFPINLFVNRVTVFIGKISFSLYLCHVACAYWLSFIGIDRFLPANPYLHFAIRFFILLGFSSVIASILFFTVEKGGIALGKKIINRHEKNSSSYISASAKVW